MKTRKDVENKLIDFCCSIMDLVESMGDSVPSRFLSEEVVSTSTSAMANYANVRETHSRKDFIKQIKVVSTSLRKSDFYLALIDRLEYGNNEVVTKAIEECDILLAIFTKSAMTASKNGAKAESEAVMVE